MGMHICKENQKKNLKLKLVIPSALIMYKELFVRMYFFIKHKIHYRMENNVRLMPYYFEIHSSKMKEMNPLYKQTSS